MYHQAQDFESYLSPRFGTYVATYLVKRELDPAPLFRRAGIPYRSGEESLSPITPSKLCTLLHEAEHSMADPFIGISIGKHFSFEFAGLNALIMISAANMEHAMKARIKYDTYINNAIYDRIHTGQDVFIHGFRISMIDNIDMRHVHDLLAAQLLAVLRTGTGKVLSPIKVKLAHKAPKEKSPYYDYFGTLQIEFGASMNTLAYNHATARHPFLTANRTLHKLLTQSVQLLLSDDQGNHFTDTVYREIVRLLDNEVPSLEQVADNLHISTRTMRRKLGSEGTSFQQVKQRSLHKVAIQLLTMTNTSLSEIADQLGYSESSAFVRAFKSWEGVTPQKYRASKVD